MSDPENFVSRWSRRKREVLQETEAENPPAAAGDEAAQDDRASGKASPRSAPAPVEPGFDPASLPPIESITAETDMSGFLAAGVPPELTRAALRRAWASDPKIRNFVGLADYDWDFNAAGSMAGFGPLQMIDDVGKMAARIVQPDRAETETCNVLDPSSPPEQIAGETGSDGDHPAPTESHDQAKPNRDEPINKIGTSPHLDELTHDGRGPAAVQYETEEPDKPRSPVKRQHGGALPK